MNALVTLQPPTMPLLKEVSDEFGISLTEWRVLVDQIFPTAKSNEAITMALSYCRARKLDIYKRPVHIVPMYSSALKKMVETVWPGISEIRTTAARTGEYAGIDEVVFGPMIEREFVGEKDKWEKGKNAGSEKLSKTVRFPEWASVVVYRWVKGHKAAFHTKIFWEETYAAIGKTEVPNDMWGKRPRGQFDKCVEAAALRKAFPEEVGSMYAAEEMEGRTLIEHEPAPSRSAPAPMRPPSPTAVVEEPETIDHTEIVEGTGEAVDAIIEGDGEAFDATKFFSELETQMAGAMDEATVEEVWTALDPEGTFDGDDLNLDIAHKIKARRLTQLHPLNGM